MHGLSLKLDIDWMSGLRCAETLQLVFGPGTRLVEEAALEYVRRTVAHKPQAAGIINELEAHRVSSKKKVAAVLEEIKRPSTLDISYGE